MSSFRLPNDDRVRQREDCSSLRASVLIRTRRRPAPTAVPHPQNVNCCTKSGREFRQLRHLIDELTCSQGHRDPDIIGLAALADVRGAPERRSPHVRIGDDSPAGIDRNVAQPNVISPVVRKVPLRFIAQTMDDTVTPERWRQLVSAYEGALARPPEERKAFLATACADASLRGEVEALLAESWPPHPRPYGAAMLERLLALAVSPPSDREQDSASPTVPSTGSELAVDARFAPGVIFASRYRIVNLLGRGAMGEVYRAEDLKLGQPVALKLLSTRGPGRDQSIERLGREVRLARRIALRMSAACSTLVRSMLALPVDGVPSTARRSRRSSSGWPAAVRRPSTLHGSSAQGWLQRTSAVCCIAI